MIFAYIFIIGTPAMLIFFIIKKMRRLRYIMQRGVISSALITHVYTQRFSRGSMDVLTLEYTDAAGRRYPAKATVPMGQYRAGERMRISYLAQDPAKYAFDKGQGYWFVLVFCILLLLFMIFASYKINEMVQAGNYHYTG
jgi:hypothetical protein